MIPESSVFWRREEGGDAHLTTVLQRRALNHEARITDRITAAFVVPLYSWPPAGQIMSARKAPGPASARGQPKEPVLTPHEAQRNLVRPLQPFGSLIQTAEKKTTCDIRQGWSTGHTTAKCHSQQIKSWYGSPSSRLQGTRVPPVWRWPVWAAAGHQYNPHQTSAATGERVPVRCSQQQHNWQMSSNYKACVRSKDTHAKTISEWFPNARWALPSWRLKKLDRANWESVGGKQDNKINFSDYNCSLRKNLILCKSS